MRISVFGIGYVGAVSAACLCQDGHTIIAVDPNQAKTQAIMAGQSPIIEPGLNELITAAVAKNALTATQDAYQAIIESELSIVCVGTPSLPNGDLETRYISYVAEEIGGVLRNKPAFHSVVVRSTILPGTMEALVIPLLEKCSGKKAGQDFGVGYYPEFLREGSAIKDYFEPGAIIYGCLDDITARRLGTINQNLPQEATIVDIATAEAIKYTNNAWHAVKVSFANEVGNICKALGIDSHKVFEILCSDKRLNISPAYLKPGFAFGGSCLPKDLRALRYKAKQSDVRTPLLDATLDANEVQIQKAFDMIVNAGKRRVGLIGLSFKPDTDDLRESPLLELAERLYGKGYDIKILDPHVRYAALIGANRHFVQSRLPHLTQLLVDDLDEVCAHADVIILGKKDGAALNVYNRLKGQKSSSI
ncbi:MAG: UDP-glucose/GDP-mannose dehydrogenase family protein [Gammaproteobacteria bacterium]